MKKINHHSSDPARARGHPDGSSRKSGADNAGLGTLHREKLDNGGFVAEIATEACKRSGYDLEIKYYPWARNK